MQQYKQRQMSATVKGSGESDQLGHKIVEQEGAIHTMENRNYFSLYCLQMETQLIHSNLEMLVIMVKNLVDIEIKKHQEVSMLLLSGRSQEGSKRDMEFSKIQIGDKSRKVILKCKWLAILFVQLHQYFSLYLRILCSFLFNLEDPHSLLSWY